MKPTMARERRALGKSILEKKEEMVERAIIRIIHNKIIEFTSRRMYIQAKGKYHHFHAPQYRNCLSSGTKYSMVYGGNIWKWEKIPFFFPPSFTSFSVINGEKNWTRGENIILFLLKLISKKLSRKKGKINTIQHGQGEKQTKNIFPQYTARESRTINCMA